MSKVKLSLPVIGIDGNEVSELELKPITAGMYLRHGELMYSEVRTNGNVETIIVKTDMDVLRGYILSCTGLPEPVVMNMAVSDIQAIKQVIEGFFGDFVQES